MCFGVVETKVVRVREFEREGSGTKVVRAREARERDRGIWRSILFTTFRFLQLSLTSCVFVLVFIILLPLLLLLLEGFVDAMARFGYTGLSPSDIVTTGKQIREEISKEDPIQAKALSHTQIRSLAIRREIEKIILQRKLQACADDWATQVSSLSPLVVANAKM
jgi:hypothetical protein